MTGRRPNATLGTEAQRDLVARAIASQPHPRRPRPVRAIYGTMDQLTAFTPVHSASVLVIDDDTATCGLPGYALRAAGFRLSSVTMPPERLVAGLFQIESSALQVSGEGGLTSWLRYLACKRAVRRP